MFKENFFTCLLLLVLLSNTTKVLTLFSNASLFSLCVPVLAFHTIAFVVSFIHWFLDTWTTDNESVRKRLFNQAKTHHYYPGLVVKKEVFARNDDAIYGSIMFGIVFKMLNNWCSDISFNWMLYVHCLSLSTLVSLEIHRYAHMPIVEVPGWIRILQRTGIILSRESHYQHHNGKYNGSYDLMSGWMNDIINASGLYPILERLVTHFLGWKPRTYLTDTEQKKELTAYYKGHD